MKLLWHKEEKASLGNYSREPCKLSKIRLGIFINRALSCFCERRCSSACRLKAMTSTFLKKLQERIEKSTWTSASQSASWSSLHYGTSVFISLTQILEKHVFAHSAFSTLLQCVWRSAKLFSKSFSSFSRSAASARSHSSVEIFAIGSCLFLILVAQKQSARKTQTDTRRSVSSNERSRTNGDGE